MGPATNGSGQGAAQSLAEGIRICENRGEADEWALVLASERIDSRIVRIDAGFGLQVRSEDRVRADRALRAYERENASRGTVAAPIFEEFTGPAPLNAALLMALAMIGFYSVTGPRHPEVVWFIAGSADAFRILGGELWRCVTALSLHADLGHLTGNVLFGSFFLTAAGRSLGPGVALALVLLSGAGGNLVNALVRSSAHNSIGASTAVFGAIGLMSGLAAARRRLRGEAWRRAFLPLAAGLGLLAMLGTAGDRVDLFAHLFGLLLGAVLGATVGVGLQKPPDSWIQWLCGVGSIAVLLESWTLALR